MLSQSINPETAEAEDPILQIQAKSDSLINGVDEQIALGVFEPIDEGLKQLVEGLRSYTKRISQVEPGKGEGEKE